MRSLQVVFIDIFRNAASQPFGRFVFCYVQIIAFQAPKPTFNYHVIHPACLAVHTLPDALITEIFRIIIAGELATLVRIDDFRLAVHRDSSFCRHQDRRGIKTVGQFKTHDIAAVPVDYRRQIHVTSAHFDVGYINRPNLIRCGNSEIFQQIRKHFVCRITLGQVRFRVHRVNTHLIHIPLYKLASGSYAVLLEFHHKSADTQIAHLRVPIIYAAFDTLFALNVSNGRRFGLVIIAAAADAEQLALPLDAKTIILGSLRPNRVRGFVYIFF